MTKCIISLPAYHQWSLSLQCPLSQFISSLSLSKQQAHKINPELCSLPSSEMLCVSMSCQFHLVNTTWMHPFQTMPTHDTHAPKPLPCLHYYCKKAAKIRGSLVDAKKSIHSFLIDAILLPFQTRQRYVSRVILAKQNTNLITSRLKMSTLLFMWILNTLLDLLGHNKVLCLLLPSHNYPSCSLPSISHAKHQPYGSWFCLILPLKHVELSVIEEHFLLFNNRLALFSPFNFYSRLHPTFSACCFCIPHFCKTSLTHQTRLGILSHQYTEFNIKIESFILSLICMICENWDGSSLSHTHHLLTFKHIRSLDIYISRQLVCLKFYMLQVFQILWIMAG